MKALCGNNCQGCAGHGDQGGNDVRDVTAKSHRAL